MINKLSNINKRSCISHNLHGKTIVMTVPIINRHNTDKTLEIT